MSTEITPVELQADDRIIHSDLKATHGAAGRGYPTAYPRSGRDMLTDRHIRKSIRNQRINSVVIVTLLTLVAIAVLWPIVHVIAAAFTPGNSVAQMPVVPFSAGVTLDHFRHLFTGTLYPRWFLNTLIVATSTMVLTLIFASLAAYIFSRFRFTFKKSFMMSMLVLNVFPAFVGMVAIFVILLRLGLLDSLYGLALVYVAGNLPFSTWMMKSYMDNVPREMDEAARIDGASSWRIWFSVIMPMCRPMLTFLAMTTFIMPWMDFIFPRMILRSPANQTLALGLFSFVTDRNNFFTTFAAGSVIIAIPFIIFFVLTQKTLVSSLAGAAVKG